MPDPVLVIAAHPHLRHSRITRQLLRAVQQAALPGVTLVDLYARYPDYLIDVAREQAALAAARSLVWLHPVHWYSMPPLLKLWLDEVFSFGWAYGPGGDALAGKHFWLVASTGGGTDSYSAEGHHRHAFSDFLLPYRQTARLTRMCWVEPLVLHAAHRASEAEVRRHAEDFLRGLRDLASGSSQGMQAASDAAVPDSDRPPSLPAR